MSEAICDCPHCRRPFNVTWGFDTLRTAYLHGEDGMVVTNCDCIFASRVMYLHHVVCPHCGTRLRVGHELAPRFYAKEEGANGTD